MHSRVPRATRMRTDSLPSDRTPDRKAPARRVAKESGNDRTRLNLAPEEQAKRNLRNADAHGNLAAMCFERAGVDLRKPAEEQEVPHGWTRLPTTAATVVGALDFLLLANILGLDGAR